MGLHRRFKCRVRDPWYTIPSVYSTEVGLLKRSHDFPRLVLNTVSAYSTDTAYRIRPKAIDPAGLVSGFVNSLTALSAELEGRHYGGGVLELVPSEIRKLVLPVGRGGRRGVRKLDAALRRGDGPEVLLAERDHELLSELGVSLKEQQVLLDAWLRLRGRRQRIDDGRDVAT
jgi:hypothetical protein